MYLPIFQSITSHRIIFVVDEVDASVSGSLTMWTALHSLLRQSEPEPQQTTLKFPHAQVKI